MSKQAFREYLDNRLAVLKGRIAEADRRLANGEFRERVQAAGDLAIFKRRQAELLEKSARLDREPDGIWENLKTEIEEDLASIAAAVEQLIQSR